MKIFSVEQIREADAFTIKNEPVLSIDLMERAAMACVNWITERYDISNQFKIICGLGNNGGDGLAIARLLAEQKYSVELFIINYSDKRSADFSVNYERLKPFTKNNIIIHEIDSVESFQKAFVPTDQSVLIDALFGSGLNKKIEGFTAKVVEYINRFPIELIAIDVPSGLYCDELNDRTDPIIKAAFTLTFQFPKLSFMFPETAEYVGEFSVLDIGLHSGYMEHTQTKNYFITKNDAAVFLKKRNRSAHKGNFGHALIVAGSYGKMGAAVLSAKACVRSGAGLLTAHIPKCGYGIMQISVPEVMAETDSESHFISDNILLEKYNAVGTGPGIGLEKQTQNVIKLLIQNAVVPIVFDADAINIISENKTWLSFVRAGSIFTPHVKEFERLAGKSSSGAERLKMQREFSAKYSVYVILKGAHTSISCPDGNVFFNSTGNPGMATGGSGDILTGIITSLLAQGYTSQQACILGVYIHGLAGDFAAQNRSQESMVASDIIEHLSDAFNFLRI